ncbi:cytochrome-c oxidase, cbb3-type subunit III [Limobrevibacterium gyesilva]|uniref:Cbb3-type cytochrome c oxidase subunit n=1 Tax=Limobrevibacterium gyesilva TaxID=2991712 RepID=A0AA42CFL1_9PROT|nr:cytochrome-c oxidase, cbb3-type subunit III [Limobrevibacterium gyesilva]
MPTKIEKDSISGQDTTGHEWDGLKELNTPLPKWWLYTLYATCVWAVVWCVLYPSVPGISGYFPGVLGASTRVQVTNDVKALAAQRAVTMDKLTATPIAEVRQDPQLMAVATTAGRIAFANNCQPCHGPSGEGRPGYPALAGDAWIWGGKLADLQQTITYGIRSGHPDARVSQMPRFGADGILKPEEIAQVADYVMTLYGKGTAGADMAKGRAIYGENCAACHGDNGEGKRDVGAPALKGAVHLYGDSRETVRAQIANPRQGVMPNWNQRLDEATIKSLALYVHSLGGGE